MAAFKGCLGTVYLNDTSPEEVLGVSMWEMSQSVKNQDYSDNTTGCNISTIMGAKTTKVNLDVNMQDGVTKGLPPIMCGSEHVVQLHIDDTTENYFEMTLAFLTMDNYNVNMDTGDKVSCKYTAQAQGAVVGFGTLATFTS